MRHRRSNRRFGRAKGERDALVRHLATALILNGRIETTLPKAKDARRFVDRLIQFGVRGDLFSYRRALQALGNAETTSYLFKEVAPLFKTHRGGYTRLLRSRVRPGDGAELALLELLERKVKPKKEKRESPKEESKKTKAKKTEAPSPKEEVPGVSAPPEKPPKAEKPSGFLASLRKFLKPKDRS
ncbi:MAG: 50S ribosomal protein L17 [Candidatus Omnitrophica bacterium]|nr:50S ribosomal protein L17 [Candidatus Omnitrophota bacterium]